MKKLTENFERLTESEKRVCNYIVQNYEAVADMSINKLAQNSLTSKTVVINTAQKLDFSGFTELRYYLKNLLVEEERQEVLSPAQSRDAVLKLAQMTGDIIDFDLIDKAAKIITKARTIYVAGRGTSKSCSGHLAHLFQIIGIKCVLISDYNLLTIMAERLDEDEVFILFSLSGETRKIIQTAEIVKSRNASLIAMTSFSHNTLSRLADVNLYAATENNDTAEDDHISRIGFFVLAEILANQVKINIKKT